MSSHRSFQPSLLALQTILALLQLLDVFQVWYFPMIHRTLYSFKFQLGFSIVYPLLFLSAADFAYLLKWKKYEGALLPVFVSLIFYPFFGVQAFAACISILLIVASLLYFRKFEDYFFWVLGLLIGFEGMALIHWILLPLGFVSPLGWFADLELAMFYVFAPLAPLIMISIPIILVLKPIIRQYLGNGRAFIAERSYSTPNLNKVNLHPWALLLASLIIAVVSALYPYSPTINPNRVPCGVDVQYYVEWMIPVIRNPLSSFTIVNGSRPLILLLIYLIQNWFGVLETVTYLPLILNPLLVLSVFFMVLSGTKDFEWACLSSFFSATGFTITVGMYSYFLANMLGLIFIYLAIGFLFMTIRTEKIIHLTLASAMGSLVLFTHPWTFTQYYIAIAMFLLYTHLRAKRNRESIIIISFLIVLGMISLLKGATGGLEIYGSITSTDPKLTELVNFWGNNIFAFRYMYGGLLSNLVLLGIAAFGVYLLNNKKRYHLFLTLLLLLSSLYYLLVDGSNQTKLLYNLPFSILAALGILFLVRNPNLERRNRTVLFLFIQIYMLTYLLRSLANLI